MSLRDLANILPKDHLIKVAASKPDLVDWNEISRLEGKLSEEFIERNANRVNWKFISRYQKLSEPLPISLGIGSTGIIMSARFSYCNNGV
mgnify:CR=1 FL=1